MAPNNNIQKDNDGNEITASGKFWAGLAVILFTLGSALYLIGHWPDRLPAPGDNRHAFYSYEWFHVRLVTHGSDTTAKAPADKPIKTDTATGRADSSVVDTAGTGVVDSSRKTDTERSVLPAPGKQQRATYTATAGEGLIHINTLLLILVAAAGFLGNMIHIATSFTTYVGAGKFKKSWTLWYCTKPFSAAALAIAIYFVFRGGFLNMTDDSANINIYGLMTLSILAGLFTDRTTLKLKELFEVLLRPKEERPDTLDNNAASISIKADPLEAGKPTTITLTGSQLNKGEVDVSIEGEAITDLVKNANTVTFSYTLPEQLKDKETVTLLVKAGSMTKPVSFPLKIKPAS